MSNLTYNNIVNNMLMAIPEVRPVFEKELEWWSEVLPHIVFGDVLNPYLLELLKSDKEIDALKRIFDFFEQMANCNDEKVQNVLAVTVLERLGDEKTILNTATKYMGKQTKVISNDVEKALGRKK